MGCLSTDVTVATNANGHRRRQVRAQVLAEETNCAICGEPVNKTPTYQWGKHGPRCTNPACAGCVPHPMRAEVDEIIPRHEGGSPYQRSNCRLTHRDCNNRRHTDRGKTNALRADLPATRNWLTPGGDPSPR